MRAKNFAGVFINPIVKKEIKQRTRGIKFPATLGGYLLGFTLILWYILSSIMNDTVDVSMARGNFQGVYIFITFLIAAYFGLIIVILCAQAIAKERENQTLDILLSTKMSSFEIVVGKMIAAIGELLIVFISTLPVLVLLYLYSFLGIIELLEIFSYLFIMLLFFGSIGILMSALLKRSMGATVLTLIIIGVLTIGGFIGLLIVERMANQIAAQQNTNIFDFWRLVLSSLSPVLALVEFLNKNMNFMGIWKYHYQIKGYQIHLIICVVGTILNCYLTTIILDPLRGLKRAKKNKVKKD